MHPFRKVLAATLVFGLAGLLGPLVYYGLVRGHQEVLLPRSGHLVQFYLQESLSTLWPARMLALAPLFQQKFGANGGVPCLVAANITFFASCGLLVGLFFARSRRQLAAGFVLFGLVLLTHVVAWGCWSFDFFSPVAFLSSLLVLLIPFWLTLRLNRIPAGPELAAVAG